MSDSTRTGFTLVTLVLALLAAGVAAVLALTFLTSPLDDQTLSSAVAVESLAGDAVFVAMVAAALSALVIAGLFASWRPSVRLAVRFGAAGLMTAIGITAALTLDPASASLQARFMVYPHAEGGTQLLRLFTPWIERLAALSWVYTACGTGLLIFTVLGVLASLGARRRHSRTAARAV
jgi:hypothetical protein